MKRRLTKLVVFLLLGAIINVGVAWGCATWSKIKWTWGAQWGEAAVPMLDSRVVQSLSDHEVIEGAFSTHYGFGRRCDFSRAIGSTTRFGVVMQSAASLYVFYEGWPLKTATWEYFIGPGHYGGKLNFAFRPTPPFDRSRPGVIESRALPLRPIWPGVAINTIFYAAILWLLTLGPFAGRRMIRRRRGHCIKCGYDLRGAEHEVCPECGVAGGPAAVASG